MGCSPIKAVRELGLERRETVDIRAVYKLGYMLETPIESCATRQLRRRDGTSQRYVGVMRSVGSDKAPGAVNQQERLDAYIAGFVDGEGSFHVAVQRNSSMRIGFQLVPEVPVSQDVCRREILDLIQRRFGC